MVCHLFANQGISLVSVIVKTREKTDGDTGATFAGIRKAVRHARMAHKATKWPIKKILTGPVMRPDRTKLVK